MTHKEALYFRAELLKAQHTAILACRIGDPLGPELMTKVNQGWHTLKRQCPHEGDRSFRCHTCGEPV